MHLNVQNSQLRKRNPKMSNDPRFADIDCDNVNSIEKIVCEYAAESRSMNNLIDSLENAQYHATTKLDEGTFNHIKEWITSNNDECHKKLSLYLDFAKAFYYMTKQHGIVKDSNDKYLYKIIGDKMYIQNVNSKELDWKTYDWYHYMTEYNILYQNYSAYATDCMYFFDMLPQLLENPDKLFSRYDWLRNKWKKGYVYLDEDKNLMRCYLNDKGNRNENYEMSLYDTITCDWTLISLDEC